VQKGQQHPTHAALYDLLNDPDVCNGLVVRFSCGLRYVVGTGWTMEGEAVTDEVAHPLLRKAFHDESKAEYDRGTALGIKHAAIKNTKR
jgi:hypothetical protein